MKCFDLKSTSGSWFSSGGSQFWQQNASAKLAGFDGGIGCICGKLFRPSTSTFESICRPGHFSRDSQRVKHRAAFSDMVTRHIKLQKKVYTRQKLSDHELFFRMSKRIVFRVYNARRSTVHAKSKMHNRMGSSIKSNWFLCKELHTRKRVFTMFAHEPCHDV